MFLLNDDVSNEKAVKYIQLLLKSIFFFFPHKSSVSDVTLSVFWAGVNISLEADSRHESLCQLVRVNISCLLRASPCYRLSSCNRRRYPISLLYDYLCWKSNLAGHGGNLRSRGKIYTVYRQRENETSTTGTGPHEEKAREHFRQIQD